MPLSPGTKLGQYEVRAALGAGGMGEVYRARDGRLERDVAIKVMLASSGIDADRRTRFEREAKAIAALNHPNIVAVHDFGEQDGALYIVTELIEGESLRRRIERGAIGIRELLAIAVQFADGVSAAHQAGIVHRDLKPENIMLTPEGRVKILDFGLARQTLSTLGATPAADRTVTISQTVPGAIMGTVNYMSPEQARGAEAGFPSDQFSFGIILYEMASGTKAFERETMPQTLTAVLVEEPKPLDAKVPAPLRWTISRCLAKDPAARYGTTRDLFHDLRNQQEHLSELSTISLPAQSTAPPKDPRRAQRTRLAAALLAGSAAGALAVWLLTPKPHPFERLRYTPIETSLDTPLDATWSPDGTAFVYSALVEGRRTVFLRHLNSPLPTRLTVGGAVTRPIGWTPDSKRIYVAGRNPSGNQPFLALFTLSVTGGEPELVMPLDIVTPGGGFPRVSADGKVLLAMRHEADGKYSLSFSSPPGAPWKRYSPGPFESVDFGNVPAFALSPDASKIALFVNPGSGEQVWLLPFPPGTGTPRRILQTLPTIATPEFSWLPDSRRMVTASVPRAGDVAHLALADSGNAAPIPITAGPIQESQPAVSPDGRHILVRESTYDYRVVSASLADASITTLIRSVRPAGTPYWAGKGERFVYATAMHGDDEIWMREADGSERPVLTAASFPQQEASRLMTPAISPRGDRLAFFRSTAQGEQSAIWISSVSGGTPIRLTNDNALEGGGAWSPDGSRFVYIRGKGGITSLMVAKTSGQSTPVELSPSALTLPDWSPTGEWLLFRKPDGWTLISPDGQNQKPLGRINALQMAFAPDGKSVYGVRVEGQRNFLFSMPIDGGQMKTIGEIPAEFAPRSYLSPGLRLSVAPDGKSLLYPTFTSNTSLWMIDDTPR